MSFETWAQIAGQAVAGSRLLAVRPLAGGVSAQVTALDITSPDTGPQTVVVRRHGDLDFALKPHVAATEFALLRRMQALGVPVPQPLYLDESSNLLGRPFLVTSHMPGRTHEAATISDNMVAQMAEQLARIHAVPAGDPVVERLPEMAATVGGRLAHRPESDKLAPYEGALRDALEAVWPLSPRNPAGLLHGDYWPGNLLWEGDRLSAILDWEDAQQGDPLGDLAQARLEILWAYGNSALEAFTTHYLTRNPLDTAQLPLWDIWAALRPIGVFTDWASDEAEARMWRERHQAFAQSAMSRLGVSLLP